MDDGMINEWDDGWIDGWRGDGWIMSDGWGLEGWM